MTLILGVHAGAGAYHDAAACLLDGDGTVLAFVEEERLTRVRHARGTRMPVRAVAQCLRLAERDAREIELVALGWDEPRMAGQAGRVWDFTSRGEFLTALGLGRAGADLCFTPHHRAHAASAFHASGYERAAVVVVDGNGEDASASIYRARRGSPLVELDAWPQVCSVGHLYEAASRWLGLGRHGAGKTMGLAAYAPGPVEDPGWLVGDGDRLVSTLGADPRLGYDVLAGRWDALITAYAGAERPATPPAGLDRDPRAVRVAAAAQATVEHVLGWLAARARARTGLQALCLAGGVALNCAANATLAGPLYIPPVPHDAGVALGAAWAQLPPRRPAPLSAYLGGRPGPLPAGQAGRAGAVNVDAVADLLAGGRIVGICRGRAEAGPRALGHRSLLASPTSAGMRERMNRLKGREAWRPFGPVTHTEPGLWWSPVGQLDRYMLGAAALTDRGLAELPAIAHADATTRPQRLRPGDDPFLDAVLDALARHGHPPVLLNTSFNGPGEPLVDSAADAWGCARRLGADAVVTDDLLLRLTPTSAAAR